MKLDLRHQAPIPSSLVMRYNEVALEARRPFCNALEGIARKNTNNLDWFLASPSSRNIFESPLFHNCCKLALVKSLVEDGEEVDEITTDSTAMSELLSSHFSKEKTIKFTLEQQALSYVLPVARLFGYLGRTLLGWLLTAFCRTHNRGSLPQEPLILIDTFVMQDFVEQDRYYPGLLEHLGEQEQAGIFFVPTFFRIKPQDLKSVILRLRKKEGKYLFKEEFLTLGDYLHSWLHAFRSMKLNIVCEKSFYGFDLSGLINEEIGSFLGLQSAMIGWQNFHFARRLKESGINVGLTVDWYENQVVDRGWNAGFRKYFPEAVRIGYLGFTSSPYYLCARPLHCEKEAGVLPDRIGVLGLGLFKDVREFCEDLDVFSVPAFRVQHLFQPIVQQDIKRDFTVLAALPVSTTESVRILKMIGSLRGNCTLGVRFIIKPHPTMDDDFITRHYAGPSEDIVCGQESFADLLSSSDLLISVSSSVCLESLAKGVPVIVLGSDHDLTYNPIPEGIGQDFWRLCRTEEELSVALQFFLGDGQKSREARSKLAHRILGEYFTPVTEKTVREFLGFDR